METSFLGAILLGVLNHYTAREALDFLHKDTSKTFNTFVLMSSGFATALATLDGWLRRLLRNFWTLSLR